MGLRIRGTTTNNNNNINNSNNNNYNGFEGHNTQDDHSQHGRTERSLYNFLQPDQTTQASCIIFSLNIQHFEIKSRVVHL